MITSIECKACGHDNEIDGEVDGYYHLDRQDFVTKEWLKYRKLLPNDTPSVDIQIMFCRIAGEIFDERHQ